MIRTLVGVLAIVFCTVPAFAGIFDLAGRPPTRIVVITDQSIELPAVMPPTPMLRLLSGVVHEMSSEEIQSLRTIGADAKRKKPEGGAYRFGVLRLIGPKETKDLELIRDENSEFFVRQIPDEENDKVPCFHLARERIARLSDGWDRYRGSFLLPEGTPVAEDSLVDGPYAPGWYRASREELGDRLLRGRHTKIKDPMRRLADERFHVRLPTDYKPRLKAGLLVWVNAGTSADLPDEFSEWLDESGFIMIGALNIGNSRPTADRYQLAMDMVETARSRYVVDETRVYVTGISGGGRISSHLWMGWPEVFRGAAPIVGLGFYEPIPIGDRTFYPPDYDKPEDRQLNLVLPHHIATISGPLDFNYAHIKPCTELMRLHGFEARFFDVPDMGHTLPPPKTFSEAMNWVDLKGKAAAAAEIDGANAVLVKLSPDEAKRNEQLIEITRIAPWTRPAWEAAELLKGVPDTSAR